MQPVLARCLVACLVLGLFGIPARAEVERQAVLDFLETTGFDVALESIRFSAESAPAMLGREAGAFGDRWTDLADEVFDTGAMEDIAVGILAQTMTPELLDHGTTFYATGLGQRIVAAENASHMVEDETAKSEAGEAIFAELVREGSPRVGLIRRLTSAIDTADTAMRAVQEIQLRFLLAAAGAGVIELRLDEPDLRKLLARQQDGLRLRMRVSALGSAAYTYRSFSDTELDTYADALETPQMQTLYELMNAVQYEVMANRFETLAARLADLQERTDL